MKIKNYYFPFVVFAQVLKLEFVYKLKRNYKLNWKRTKNKLA
jgi:hypothetical protein